MSNALALAALTSALRNLLDLGTRDNPAGTVVTTRPPDRARTAITGNQLNLFMYHTSIDAAWRNMDVPGRVGPGERGVPPLPLVLDYLLTAYGENDDETISHRVLGRAMSVLHDHPVISADDIRRAFSTADLAEIDLQHQVEGLRITYLPMTLEEMSKLWTAFQTQYRISAAYRVAVVLVDSARPRPSALPVLRQGDDGHGPTAEPGLVPAYPTLTGTTVPNPEGTAYLGDQMVLTGRHLTGDHVEVHLRTQRRTDPLVLQPAAGSGAEQVLVDLPAGGTTAWPAGIATAEVLVRHDVPGDDGGTVEVTRRTNRLPLPIGPRVLTITPDPAVRDAAGDVTLTVTVEPPVAGGQSARLLLADREVEHQPAVGLPAPFTTLDFVLRSAPPGRHLLRIRVDGTDSRLVVDTPDGPGFDEAMGVTIQ